MDFIPATNKESEEMLKAVGISELDGLFADIPSAVPRVKLDIPSPLSEPELIKALKDLAKQNFNVKEIDNYLGAGSYEHFIPSVVKNLSARAEFVTAYTPYQAEANQGLLQAMYEYQTLICQLTGMDVSNASLYDGGTALAEAVLTAYRNRDILDGKILVSRTVHPGYRQVVKTYISGIPVQMVDVPYNNGITDIDFIKDNLDEKTLAVVAQSPNFFGCLEPLHKIVPLVKKYNTLMIVSANPISLGVLKSPGSFGADIVVGEGQALGTPLSYGGPYLGYFAVTKKLLRKIPGRLVGRTKDTKGRTGYVLTLQTREQHIRREKASSNICTNEALNALSACIYLTLLGKQGMKDVSENNIYLSHYAKDKLCDIAGVKDVFSRSFFNEFVLKCPVSSEKFLKKGIIGGLDLERFYPELKGCSLWCVTETKNKEQIDRLAEVIKCGLQ